MEKIISIGNKDYKMKASAFTLFAYKNEFKSDLLKDLKQILVAFKDIDLDKFNSNSEDKELMSDIFDNLSIFDGSSDMINILYQISYIMVREADKSQTTNFEEFLKGIDAFLDDSNWISDVIDLALSPFGGRNKAHKGE